MSKAARVPPPEFRRRGTKPCPNPPKGQRCPLCGGEWVCIQTWRKLPERIKEPQQ